MKSNIYMAATLVAVLHASQGFAQGLPGNTVQNGTDAASRPAAASHATGSSAAGASTHHMMRASAKNSSNSSAKPKPKLKPDYPCQDLHVKPVNCPPR